MADSRPRAVQATVRQWDPASGAGDVLLDDGRLVSFSGDAFSVSGLRLLRLGQRVRMQFDGAGNVAWVTIATLPDPVD